jgi:hypothetical protein
MPDQPVNFDKIYALLGQVKALSDAEWRELRCRIGDLDGTCPDCLKRDSACCSCDDVRDD